MTHIIEPIVQITKQTARQVLDNARSDLVTDMLWLAAALFLAGFLASFPNRMSHTFRGIIYGWVAAVLFVMIGGLSP